MPDTFSDLCNANNEHKTQIRRGSAEEWSGAAHGPRKSAYPSPVKLANGSVPLNWFWASARAVTAVRAAKELGIVPVRALPVTSMLNRPEIPLMVDGSVPTSPLLGSDRDLRQQCASAQKRRDQYRRVGKTRSCKNTVAAVPTPPQHSQVYRIQKTYTTGPESELHPTPAQVHGWLLVSQLVATVHPRPPAAKKRSTKACRSGTEQVVYAPLQFVMQLEDHVDDDAGNRVVSPLGTLPVR